MSIYIPISVYLEAMQFSESEDASAILIHSVEGLVRSGMVEANFHYGSQEYLAKSFSAATEPGLIMAPSVFGAEVFLWGQGVKGATGHEVVKENLQLPPPEISIPVGYQIVQG